MEEILLTPQPCHYYEIPDSYIYPAIDTEYEALAEELNKDIKYFQRNRRGVPSQDELLNDSRKLSMNVAESTDEDNNSGQNESAAAQTTSFGKVQQTEMKKDIGLGLGKGIAKEVAKEAGKGLLRGLFRK
jgi:hypothetical protein